MVFKKKKCTQSRHQSDSVTATKRHISTQEILTFTYNLDREALFAPTPVFILAVICPHTVIYVQAVVHTLRYSSE